MNRPILNIEPESFAKYGAVLDFSDDFEGHFQIIVREEREPWRLAVYRPRGRECTFFENHPGSMESFEPQRGTSLIAVAENADPESYQVFLLDRPVCLWKGVWHNVIALSDDVLIRVTENLDVECVFHQLEKPISAHVGA